MESDYRKLLRALHAALDTGNPSDGSETLHLATEAYADKRISFAELAELRADFYSVYADYQK